MNYELAKKLRENGFIYNGKRKLMERYDRVYAPAHPSGILSSEYELVPTLSELVGACVKIMEDHNSWDVPIRWEFVLSPNMPSSGNIKEIGKVSEWRASWEKWGRDDEYQASECNNYFGETPEIAVANLWLALNKK